MRIEVYNPKYFNKWNEFVDKSANGTIFHRLDFLQYHSPRFKSSEHHLMWFKGEAIFAIMPFAILEEDGVRTGKSPYGASFGGIVHQRKFRLKDALEVWALLKEYLSAKGVDRFKLTLAPEFYSEKSNSYLEYLFNRDGANLAYMDIFNSVRLNRDFEKVWLNFEGRARTSIRKCRKDFDLHLNTSAEEFFPILLEDKIRHADSVPTHNLRDLQYLKSIFPERVIFDVAVAKVNQSRAGICYFICSDDVILTFYMAQENLCVGLNGINVLLEHGFKRASQRGLRFLDFGGSSVGYDLQNSGVANFKESFGAESFLRKTYCIQVGNLN